MSNFPFNVMRVVVIKNVQSEDHIHVELDGPGTYSQFLSTYPLIAKFTTAKGEGETYAKIHFKNFPIEVIDGNRKSEING